MSERPLPVTAYVAAPDIAWEGEGSFFHRLWETVQASTLDPVGTFRALRDAPTNSKTLSLSVITAAIGNWPYLLCAPCLALVPLMILGSLSSTPLADQIPPWVRGIGMGAMCAMVAALPFLIVLSSLFTDLVHGASFFVVGKLFGGKGTLSGSMRAGMYSGVIRFWLWPVLLLGFVPMIGTILQLLGRLALIVWSGFALYGAAQSVHGLEERPAIAVGVLTPVLALSLFVMVWGGAFIAMWALFAGGLHTLPEYFPR
jgi:hypothetical protein